MRSNTYWQMWGLLLFKSNVKRQKCGRQMCTSVLLCAHLPGWCEVRHLCWERWQSSLNQLTQCAANKTNKRSAELVQSSIINNSHNHDMIIKHILKGTVIIQWHTERADFSECPLSSRTAKEALRARQPSSLHTPSHFSVWLVTPRGNCRETEMELKSFPLEIPVIIFSVYYRFHWHSVLQIRLCQSLLRSSMETGQSLCTCWGWGWNRQRHFRKKTKRIWI